jgi:hypothetical protein
MLDFLKRPPNPDIDLSLGRKFCQSGFVRVPEILGRRQVAAFRKAAIAALPANAPPYQPQFSNTAVFEEPFRQVFRNERLIRTLRGLLGDDFVFLTEFSLHDSFYAGWHTDTTSPNAKAGHEFHWSPTFTLVQIAIYLQDNGANGGGLDVVPRSHLADDPLAIQMRGGTVENPYRDVVTIGSKAGDAVIFHLRISHRASLSQSPARNDGERKLALFMVAGPNNASTRRYREWLDQYDGMNGSSRPTIPAEFRTFLADAGLRII